MSAEREGTAWFGEVLALGASAMLFAALLFGCAYLRARGAEVTAVARVPWQWAPAVWAVGIAAVLTAPRSFERASSRAWLAATLAGVALGLELLFLVRLGTLGLFHSGAYGALVVTLIGVHALHGVITLLGALGARLRRSRDGLARWTLAGRYLAAVWTLVTALWVWR